MKATTEPLQDILGARVLGIFGDMFTTDHISPIGVISAGTPAAAYLASLGIAAEDFINYAARRLNHDVMTRGTFANVRVKNEMTPGVEGSSTLHMPDGAQMSIHEAAERYRAEGVPLVVVAGAEYGAGSSRDWAAKGTRLLGVRAVIAESFERIHRSNLDRHGRAAAAVSGRRDAQDARRWTAPSCSTSRASRAEAPPRCEVECTITRADGRKETLKLLVRLDTRREVEYYRHGGQLHYVVRDRLEKAA